MYFDRLKKVLDGGSDPEVHLYEKYNTGGTPDHPTAAMVILEENGVRLAALMQSENPKNRADADNQHTWETGDALEFFLQEQGNIDYYEFHSTPEGIRLQLHLPDPKTFHLFPHEEKICDIGLQVSNRIDRQQKLWYCEMFVPFGTVISGKKTFLYGLGRYDYQDDPENPKITCYPVMQNSLHSPHSWAEYSI